MRRPNFFGPIRVGRLPPEIQEHLEDAPHVELQHGPVTPEPVKYRMSDNLLRMNFRYGETMSDKPIYRHDCSTCKFIKTATIEGIIYDVYRCTNTAIGEHTWLARYGDEGGNYWSMPWAILKEVNTKDTKNTTELLRQMQDIAREYEEAKKS